MNVLTEVVPTALETEHVARGAALLDEAIPGWHERISLHDLDLASPVRCVLGQLFDEDHDIPRWAELEYPSLDAALTESPDPEYMTGMVCSANYDAGKYILGLSDDSCRHHGFNHVSDHRGKRLTTYAGLDAAWAIAVKTRNNREALV